MDSFVINAVVILTLYFLPWLVAAARNHRQRSAICVLNLLLGWTILGWAVAMVWACTESRDQVAAR